MKVLELKFKNEEDRVVTLTLDAPIEPVDPEQVRQAMDDILSTQAFSSGGGQLIEKHSARIVERYVEDITWA